MGYQTDFSGQFDLDKDLTVKQVNELRAFNDMDHRAEDYAPGNYCQWVPNEDGTAIVWDENEKFYNYTAWLVVLIDKFIRPWGIQLNGSVRWDGEEQGDAGVITIENNLVTTEEYIISKATCPHCGESLQEVDIDE